MANTLTGSAHLDINALLLGFNDEQRDDVQAILDAIRGKPQVKTGTVLLIREPGQFGEVVELGFIDHLKGTDQSRISEVGKRLRINLRPALKDQRADALPTMRSTAARAA